MKHAAKLSSKFPSRQISLFLCVQFSMKEGMSKMSQHSALKGTELVHFKDGSVAGIICLGSTRSDVTGEAITI